MPFTLQAEDDKFNVLDHTLQIVNKRGPMEKKEADRFLEIQTRHENHQEEQEAKKKEYFETLKQTFDTKRKSN